MLVKPLVFLTAISLYLCAAAATFAADNGIVIKKSAHSVSETLDRLKTLLTKKGILILAHVDHQKNATSVDMTLPPTQLLIFGNPKLGTPLMTSNPTAGLDLPMKALAWSDAEGNVWLAYNDPAYIAERHGIENRDEVISKMSNALARLTDAATSPAP